MSRPFVVWVDRRESWSWDNLREGVLVPDIYDPNLNPLYRDVLAHYDVVAQPCRIRDPDRKGKVESGVGHAKKTPLKGKRFESLEEAQAYLDRWKERWADTRIHGTTKREDFYKGEIPTLNVLPDGNLTYTDGATSLKFKKAPVETPRASNSKSSANEFAIVFDPPSNVRVAPSAKSGALCSVSEKNSIHILGSEGNWYKTDICGGRVGYIHRSQIKF